MTEKAENKDLLQPVTGETKEAACKVILGTTHASLATISAKMGAPACSRIGLALDAAGMPVFLTSSLSSHSAALEADPRASMLIGEVGKGDPLAHPRISLSGTVEKVTEADDREQARAAYLARHPKAKLYVDFSDFGFWRLRMERAGYVEGFGRAYALTTEDLVDMAARMAAETVG